MIFSSLFCRSVKQFAGLLPVIAMGAVTSFLPVNVGASVTVGSRVTLYATADGSPAPTFQWKKDGSNIPGATGAVYNIAAASLADSGSYRVTATNVAGAAESADEILSVTDPVVVSPPPTTNPPPPVTNNVAPLFTTQPAASQAVTTGVTVNLVVAASGTPAPTYQWQKNGVVLAGATNPTLTLVSVTTNDNATYTAIATNSSGWTTSSPAQLTVTPPSVSPPPPSTTVDVAPSITSQPTSSQTVAPGATVTLNVVATATPAPTFQWQKNDLAVPGATNSTLVLTGVAAADMGTYVVTVSNSAGFVVSNPAVLTVSDLVVTPPPVTPPSGTSPAVAPTFTNQPVASQSILAGAEVTFSVGVSGSPAPLLQWRKNGINILGATGTSLVLRNTTAIDAATYSVRATNSAGSVLSANAVLAVGVKPVFSTEPESQAIYLGSRVILRAVAVGMPTPTLQWFKNGVAISGATLATLLLNVTTTGDLATYYVTATNSLGTASSREATIVIAAPPIITSQPTSQTVAAKSNVTFSVGATGSPAPIYQWMKNGVNILGATNSKLTLYSVGLSDEGTYSVEAINSVGWVPSNRATLNVSAAVEQKQTDGGASTPSGPVAGVDSATVSRIVNLSVRSRAGSGNSALIVGFVIGGSASKPMLVRGVGPTLRNFGVPDALTDPALSLYSGAVMTASNDDWAKGGNVSQLVATSARLGAFTLPDTSGDAALMATLDTGAYTVQVNGKETATGVALVEVYDAAASNPASLVNLSVRTHVGIGADAPNVGFVVSGAEARRVLIRAVGPTLAAFGVSDLLADPLLEIFKGGVLLDSNDNWGGDPALSAIFARVGAFSFVDGKSRDAVLLVTLQPGAYTVVASGVSGTTGIALVEVYDVP